MRDILASDREGTTLVATTEIYDRLTGILHAVFHDDDLVATPGMTADDVEDWDSLATSGLIMSVEKEFGVEMFRVRNR